uniref:Uncharacterized protein n=1 Tax=Chromera velia CCMP2878 TaxID=1169474 RepID=A0A0G4GBL7_9ALVE|eukprot:Cvel_21055.t1-p1 / transcript=Cvel_21055.t1 / gene=Cvel_21055 / organism=Chromera_velia_CCMP2878 / gene_product=hypothetical protein / transcript_product=hypothetical protein / location=Cvel_scaffold1944:30422-34105(-) / protein_length=743 / sequence_SO=supercontig / SO=protein_coding / is_pseudo=false
MCDPQKSNSGLSVCARALRPPSVFSVVVSCLGAETGVASHLIDRSFRHQMRSLFGDCRTSVKAFLCQPSEASIRWIHTLPSQPDARAVLFPLALHGNIHLINLFEDIHPDAATPPPRLAFGEPPVLSADAVGSIFSWISCLKGATCGGHLTLLQSLLSRIQNVEWVLKRSALPTHSWLLHRLAVLAAVHGKGEMLCFFLKSGLLGPEEQEITVEASSVLSVAQNRFGSDVSFSGLKKQTWPEGLFQQVRDEKLLQGAHLDFLRLGSFFGALTDTDIDSMPSQFSPDQSVMSSLIYLALEGGHFDTAEKIFSAWREQMTDESVSVSISMHTHKLSPKALTWLWDAWQRSAHSLKARLGACHFLSSNNNFSGSLLLLRKAIEEAAPDSGSDSAELSASIRWEFVETKSSELSFRFREREAGREEVAEFLEEVKREGGEETVRPVAFGAFKKSARLYSGLVCRALLEVLASLKEKDEEENEGLVLGGQSLQHLIVAGNKAELERQWHPHRHGIKAFLDFPPAEGAESADLDSQLEELLVGLLDRGGDKVAPCFDFILESLPKKEVVWRKPSNTLLRACVRHHRPLPLMLKRLLELVAESRMSSPQEREQSFDSLRYEVWRDFAFDALVRQLLLARQMRNFLDTPFDFQRWLELDEARRSSLRVVAEFLEEHLTERERVLLFRSIPERTLDILESLITQGGQTDLTPVLEFAREAIDRRAEVLRRELEESRRRFIPRWFVAMLGFRS